MIGAPLKPLEENGKRRDSTSSIDASTCTVQETMASGDNFLAGLSRVEQPARQLTIVTMSHAEHMGLIFPNWVRLCYRRGPMEYTPYDMNMPPKLVPRPPLHYKFDPPLTERGHIVAETYGRGLISHGVRPYEIFCSPDMKSVQTAAGVVKGLGLSFTSFFGLGYPINTQYIPLRGGIVPSENIESYNLRIQSFFNERIAKIEQKYVIVISDNVMVDISQNIRIDTVDDILKSTRKHTCQRNFISLQKGEAHLLQDPVMPLTKSLYCVKPFYWSEVPLKLSVPNHPELNQN
ncbi:hypothetical protein GCK72_002495 [Caenorhabditis remanei]|uniref:Uncharacterized protein n=1 Tax=Caenorhabditis remanei TaxID=31234 RepID=A0A6A5HVE1_CAERE|nr:hypothetical protein GCK72_002495 [Caenorhabditis remanei]KAF1770674.1 hypothetical protein GCK72_002495 [Caenorhabditis remanei]